MRCSSTDPHRCTGTCRRISLEILAQQAYMRCVLIALESRMITFQSVNSVRHAIEGIAKQSGLSWHFGIVVEM